jgi:hypothetical protein
VIVKSEALQSSYNAVIMATTADVEGTSGIGKDGRSFAAAGFWSLDFIRLRCSRSYQALAGGPVRNKTVCNIVGKSNNGLRGS